MTSSDTDDSSISRRQYVSGESNYRLPNDAIEHNRLNLQHNALKLLAGSNCPVPLEGVSLKSILDLGCGGGQWAVEMAYDYPEAEVVGVDLSVVQRNDILPANLKFVQANILESLPFPDRFFDLIQMRLVPSLPDRTLLIREIHRVLRPGGTVVLIEPGESYSETLQRRTDGLIELDRLLMESSHLKKGGSSWSLAPRLQSILKDATGDTHSLFEDVHSQLHVGAIGEWPSDMRQRQIGTMLAQVLMDMMDALRPIFLSKGITTTESYSNLKDRVAAEVTDHSLKLQMPYMYAWGRRMAAE